MGYVRITKEEMDNKLKADKGWRVERSGNEHIYDFHLKKMPVIIKVASSIRIDTGRGRNKGSDAIRVYAVVKDGLDVKAKITRGLLKSRRVYRTTGWQDRLEKLVIDVMHQAKMVYLKTSRRTNN